jgi:plastocyanin
VTDTAADETDRADDDGTSEMSFGAGETAWLAIVTVLALLGVALGIAALIAASDSGGGGTPTAGGSGGAAATEATVSAAEFAFDPADVRLVAGVEATVELQNDGAVDHNWTVLDAGEQIAAESEFDESMVLAAVEDTAAGESNSTTLTLEQGEYQVICTLAGHFDAGMTGTVSAG